MTRRRDRTIDGRHTRHRVPRGAARELGLDDYCALLDRNREHLGRHGDYQELHEADRAGFECAAPATPSCGIHIDGRLAGQVDLNPVDPPRYSIGYWLDEAETGRGYATAACAAVIAWARTALDISDSYAGATLGNTASVAVLRRLGFTAVAELDTYTRFYIALR